MALSGRTMRSTLEWEMSRSCHRPRPPAPPGGSNGPPGPARRSVRTGRVALVGHGARPLLTLGERLLDLPNLRAGKMADLQADLLKRGRRGGQGPHELRVHVALDHLACPPRRIGALASPHTNSSTAGSTCAYVPTTPLSLPTETASRAARSRPRSRSSSKAHTASLWPNVVGSACTPWVRPMQSVSRCSRARRFTAASSASSLAKTKTSASPICRASAVSSSPRT
jgi:hypothetical protein